MDASFCVEALAEALARYGRPEIFNTDLGSEFTGAAFTSVLIAAGVRISMAGRGRRRDNVFIERLWRSLKYEDVYLKGYADSVEARAGIGEWLVFYDEHRLHQAPAIARRWRSFVVARRQGPVDMWTTRLPASPTRRAAR